ncbi:DUF1919 domain-containing protein [Pseudoflavonifractor phocaeensis]|uniref:DUF1919 domain-containing protein n=1 Tax=Pseudoflavonifractor phocaeensis TaxID=1870988 RepID=UPI00195ACEF7|nr:DUF1919 domain-containing protein [Pseudoflavonifractor phocaeensis]MBM6937451.1 DUF1919 domain-containing protein [Pseudoflavonifractor phocaeensis]
MEHIEEMIKHFLKEGNPFLLLRRHMARKKLQNRDFTLITSNCIGGIIYHELGVKFYSPTVNLRIDSDQFAKFVIKIDYYLEQDLKFIPSEEQCPVALLDDIRIYFTHYKTAEEARKKWEERKKRIRWDNLFIIFNDRDGISDDAIESLRQVKCRGIVIFSSKRRPEVPYVLYMDCYKDEPCVGNILEKNPWTGMRTYERYFDYVRWLNEADGSLNCAPFSKRGQ